MTTPDVVCQCLVSEQTVLPQLDKCRLSLTIDPPTCSTLQTPAASLSSAPVPTRRAASLLLHCRMTRSLRLHSLLMCELVQSISKRHLHKRFQTPPTFSPNPRLFSPNPQRRGGGQAWRRCGGVVEAAWGWRAGWQHRGDGDAVACRGVWGDGGGGHSAGMSSSHPFS